MDTLVKATPIILLLAVSLPLQSLQAEPSTDAGQDSANASVSAATATQSPTTVGTRYVSDDLYTYLHGGPGKQYRILGSV